MLTAQLSAPPRANFEPALCIHAWLSDQAPHLSSNTGLRLCRKSTLPRSVTRWMEGPTEIFRLLQGWAGEGGAGRTGPHRQHSGQAAEALTDLEATHSTAQPTWRNTPRSAAHKCLVNPACALLASPSARSRWRCSTPERSRPGTLLCRLSLQAGMGSGSYARSAPVRWVLMI